MERNILLTTLGYTFDYSRHHYFIYEDKGIQTYCEGISTAEAGAKYILSRVPVDKIVVLGPPSDFRDENIDEEKKLRDLTCFGAMDPAEYSEYQFFCYRIMQFLNRVDIEGNDLLDEIQGEERTLLLKDLRAYCMQNNLISDEKEKLDQVFDRLNQNPDRYLELLDQLEKEGADCEGKAEAWVRHYLFMILNRQKKMSTLDANEDITVQFIPTAAKQENNLKMGNLPSILDYIVGGKEDTVNIYVDLQGMDIADSHTLINVLFMLQNENHKNIRIQEIITTTCNPNRFTNPIENQKNRLELSELLSGMHAFLQYGKVDSIQRYWNSRGIEDEHIDKLIFAMQTVDAGISISNINEMEKGLRMLQIVFEEARHRTETQSMESLIFQILETGIREDYGKLLQGDEINIPALIKWAMQRHFYQQALTIIEARVPLDLVRSGIFYYARNEQDLAEFLVKVNEYYWATQPKDRYQFDDLEHYYIKFFRRREAYKKKSDNPTACFVGLRLDELYEEDPPVRAFTTFRGDKEELRRFLLTYLQIGNIRNQISHGQEVGNLFEGWDRKKQNEKMETLETAIWDFIRQYDAIHEKSGGEFTSIIIPQDEFKQYCRDNPIYWNKKKEAEAEKQA